VRLWVAGTRLRAAFDHVILAEYHDRYDGRDQRVIDVRPGMFHPTRVAALQGTLLPLTPESIKGKHRASAPTACKL
jgi:hypothetical protein